MSTLTAKTPPKTPVRLTQVKVPSAMDQVVSGRVTQTRKHQYFKTIDTLDTFILEYELTHTVYLDSRQTYVVVLRNLNFYKSLKPHLPLNLCCCFFLRKSCNWLYTKIM